MEGRDDTESSASGVMLGPGEEVGAAWMDDADVYDADVEDGDVDIKEILKKVCRHTSLRFLRLTTLEDKRGAECVEGSGPSRNPTANILCHGRGTRQSGLGCEV